MLIKARPLKTAPQLAFAMLLLLVARTEIVRAQGAGPAGPSGGGQVDVEKSRCYARVASSGLIGHEHGVEGRLVSGVIQLGATQHAGELVFDMRSFVCDTPAARKFVGLDGAIDESTQKSTTSNMTSADVLDVARFPRATFAIRSARPLPKPQPADPQWYQLEGDFVLHGVSRPLKINVVAEPARGLTRLRGQFSVLQTQHGMTPYSKAFGAVGVADELKVWGDLWVAGQ
jgi:hypothetical protein